MPLTMFTNQQLEDELASRKESKVEKSKIECPEMIEPIDLAKIVKAVKEFIEVLPTSRHRDGNEDFVFEAVLEACYGKEIWPWINSIRE